jgi:ATP-dependent HslUV protease ATP-binding subunit HslU
VPTFWAPRLEVAVENLTPPQIVAELDKYIVGQQAAKRAVAVALRTRYRRQQLPPEVRRDVLPKNILMIGPTGVGKTEIARRVARMIDAPFVKVEATRFTEAGYVGQDVETIVFDLVDAAIDLVQNQKFRLVQDRAESLAKERLIGYLYQQMSGAHPPKRRVAARRRSGRKEAPVSDAAPEESRPASGPPLPVVADRSQVVELLERAQLDDAFVEIELSSPGYGLDGYSDGPPMLSDEYDDEGYPAAAMKRVRRVSVKEARRLLIRDEANKLVDFDEIVDQAVERVEQSGVVFIDELDKIAGPQIERGSDVSGEGVQRDLLPIIEGAAVLTRYGMVHTDHVLFIGAGSFYRSKPSDLIPELQGRFPLRVELDSLTKRDFRRILVETDNSLLKQAGLLLATEEVDLRFADDAIDRIAEIAFDVNQSTENIGARRLQTVLERVLEDVSFDAASRAGETVLVDAAYVDAKVKPLLAREDLTRYIL